MPVYGYRAMDASGIEVADSIVAADEEDAHRQLADRGLFVTQVHLANSESAKDDVAGSDVGQRHASGRTRLPGWALCLWSLGFLAAGGFFLFHLGIRPVWRIVQASSWVETPCTVAASELKRKPGSGATFSIEITYRYEFNGGHFQSQRYDFVTMSSNTNVATRQEIVKAHAPGTKTVCFVNPADPNEAVLERGWTPEMWWGLFPVPFVLIGAGGLLRWLNRARKDPE